MFISKGIIRVRSVPLRRICEDVDVIESHPENSFVDVFELDVNDLQRV